MANIFRETGQLHLLATYPRVVAEPMLAYLTPVELEVVLTEMSRLHEGEGVVPEENRNPAPVESPVTSTAGSVDEQTPWEPILETDSLVDQPDPRPSEVARGLRSLTGRRSQ